MPFKLTDFTAEMNKGGFAKPSYFLMAINLPTALKIPDAIGAARSMQFRVESASLPTRIVLTHDQRYYGPQRRIPYGYAAQDLAFTVILSEDMREREMFMRWQDLALGQSRTTYKGAAVEGIFDAGYYDTAVGGASVELLTYATTPEGQAKSSTPASIFGEIRNIASAVGFDTTQITHPLGFNIFGNLQDQPVNHSVKITLIEPYPINVNEVPLSWSDDGYARLNVIMQHRYITEETRYASESAGGNDIAGLLRSGVNAFNRFKPIISLIRENGVGGALNSFTSQIRTNALNNITSLGVGL